MNTSLPAVFASHFTAKVAATCTLVSIIVFIIPARVEDESGLYITPTGVIVVHALLEFLMFALEHRYVIRSDVYKANSVVSIMLLYLVNVGAATLPIVALLYGPRLLANLGAG